MPMHSSICVVKFKLFYQNVSRPWFVHVGVAEVYTVHRLLRCMVALPTVMCGEYVRK